MPVVLKFQSTGSIPGDGAPVAMRGSSLTIGRGDENDVALPDPDRTLSKRHCVIEDHNGNVVVVDISTNGTFLNYGRLALGSTPTPLNDGDILSLGPYEIMVSIPQEGAGQAIADPLEELQVSHGHADKAPSSTDLLDAPGDGGDFLDDLLSGREGPVGPAGVNRAENDDDGLLPPLDEDEALLPPLGEDTDYQQGASSAFHSPSSQDHMSTPGVAAPGPVIPDDWEEDLLSPPGAGGRPDDADPFAEPADNGAFTGPGHVPEDFGPPDTQPHGSPEPEVPEDLPGVSSPPEVLPERPAPETPPTTEMPQPPQLRAAPEAVHGPQDVAARAFLKALGAEDVNVPPADLTATMARLGHVLRIMIEGMREILMTRTSIKSEFRIEQTMIRSGGNNPLKFSISPEQAVETMVKPSVKGYLDATDAAAQALDDIKAHEVAMVTGMEAAMRGILARLDPKALEEKIAVGGGLGSVLKSRKARYWEIYESMYADISDQAENDFHELFAREFARAYKEQLERLK